MLKLRTPRMTSALLLPEDVDRADFFAITAPHSAEGAFALRNVKDLRVGWSRAAADTVLASADNKVI